MPDECEDCGCEEGDGIILQDGLCKWCKADNDGRPFGTCDDCVGAKAEDGSCACKDSQGNERA